MGMLVFLVGVALMTSLVSADIAVSSTNQSITSVIDDAQGQSGFVSGLFLTLARSTINSVEGFGAEYGETSLITRVLIGFAVLPDWLNVMFVLLTIIFTLSLIVSIIPAVG